MLGRYYWNFLQVLRLDRVLLSQAVEHRQKHQCEERGGDEASDHRDRKRLGDKSSVTRDAERHWDQSGNRGHGGHNDGTHTALGAKIDRLVHRHALAAILIDEIDQHNRVGHHDAREHEQTDQRGNAQWRAGHEHREEGADRGKRDGD